LGPGWMVAADRAPQATSAPRRPCGGTLERIAARYPALAAAVETQVRQLLPAILPAGDGAIATEAQLDALLEAVGARVGVGERERPEPLTTLDEAIDVMVLLLAGDAVARARPVLVGRVLGAKRN